jgi:hypothetical protein
MRYTLIRAIEGREFEARVNEAIEEGWTPLGGVCIAMFENDDHSLTMRYAQAMIREGEE